LPKKPRIQRAPRASRDKDWSKENSERKERDGLTAPGIREIKSRSPWGNVSPGRDLRA